MGVEAFPGVVVFDGGRFPGTLFTVDVKLRVLRAGDVFTDAGPFLRGQSPPGFPLLCCTSGLEERRVGDV